MAMTIHMLRRRKSALLVLITGAVVALAWSQSSRRTDREKNPSGGFKEFGPESGITFRMNFLSKEQGEKFKSNLYDHGCGVVVLDYDGDGYEDIYFLNQLGTNALYKNKGDGTFVDVTKDAGVGLGDRVCVGAAVADYDNDGYPDIYVTSTRGGNVLFRNLGKGTFKNVTKEAGLELVAHSQTALFFDYDNDGYLDLFVTNTAKWTTSDFDPVDRYFAGTNDFLAMVKSPLEYNKLYRNNGNGTFSDVTSQAGLAGLGWGGDVAVFDYDGDGRQDLLVTSMFGRSQLYRNTGAGTFTEVARKVLGRTSFGAIGSKVFDFNNDGNLDLLIVDMHSDMWVPYVPLSPESIRRVEKKKFKHLSGPVNLASLGKRKGMAFENYLADVFHLQYEEIIFGNTLFKNLGRGQFEEVSETAGVETFWPWGIATADFDNDGYEDIFLPSGMGYPFFYWGNRLLMNNGDETFSERSSQYGIEPPREGMFLEEKIGGKQAARSSRCAAVADFTNGGRVDLVVNNFNDRPYYFRNQFPKKNYIAFRLQGTKSNRDAIGALVRVTMGGKLMVRQIQGAGGYLSQSSRTAHFGLGECTQLDRVEIRWPSGIDQVIHNPGVNQLHHVIEPSSPLQ